MDRNLHDAALEYHKKPTPGKLAIKVTKPMTSARDLSLAYSPGVAAACEEIAENPLTALDYTSRGNFVAVISNGTAVLGLGNIGALASKPVMEGKAALFKKFANIDSFDIEIDETDVDKLVDIIASLEPTFGGINLEDFKAPECFEIERRLRERMKIPVFHDDQHGTAIIVGAAFTNWIRMSGRKMEEIKLVANGAGASAIACLNMLVQLGLPKDNITVCDSKGVVYKGRTEGMDEYKGAYAVETNARTLGDVITGADVFLGLSAAGAVNQDQIKSMAAAPLVMALANPTPEIMPELVKEVKPDAVVCTGRSDYANQVNNVLCFPFIFRGALDVGATAINEEMKVACVKAIADLAMEEASHEVLAIYGSEELTFGPNYMIPKPFDPRLIVNIPMTVAKAAMDTGVATRPITDWEAYRDRLTQYFYRSNMLMRPLFSRSKAAQKKIVYAEGEEDRVLQAVQTLVDEKLARPILIGRTKVVETRIKKLRLRLTTGKDFDLVDPEDDPRYRDYWTHYHDIMERKGVSPSVAKLVMRTNPTVIAAIMVARGEADALMCGVIGQYHDHLRHIQDIIGLKEGVDTGAACVGLVTSRGTVFMTDTHINPNPSVSQIVEMTLMAAKELRNFGIEPKVALVSHSNFGTNNHPSAIKMRTALAEIRLRDPDLMVDGEMHADSALSEDIRNIVMPNSKLKGMANLLVMPTLEAANITYNAVKIMTEAVPVGPFLLGFAKPVHIVTHAITPRGLVNVSAVAAVGAQSLSAADAPTL
ncbi:MAG TPA: NADP-dependent malic enzyme [Alphaproteobacteria bacterium]